MDISDIQQSALRLPEDQRALLMVELMDSLPSVLSDLDDGSAEAKRRLEEMKSDPGSRRTWDEIKKNLGR